MSRPVFRRTLAPRAKIRRRSLAGFLLLGLGLILSLGGIVRVSALPAEARVQETWFAYTQELSFDYSARVTKGNIYSTDTIGPEELLRVRLPVEPPAYRRVLLSQLTDTITIRLPYRFTADRLATINASYRVDGSLVATNLWERPYPLLPLKTLSVTGSELAINDLTVTIPIRAIVQELQATAEKMKVGHDQVELKIRPVVKVEVPGQLEPITAGLSPEFIVGIRGLNVAIEVDEPKQVEQNKAFTTTRVTPLTVQILGRSFPLNTVRTFTIVFLTGLAVVLGGTLIVKWVKSRAEVSVDISRLGSSLIVARSFTIPPELATVEVQTAAQLVSIHLRTDRPVVQAGGAYYLVDGTTCFVLRYRDTAGESAD